MTIDKITSAPTPNEQIDKINEIIDNVNIGGSTATDVQVNGTSITSNNVANIITNTAYNASSNKIATMSDVNNIYRARNIGEIVQSTIPLTDAGLHLLDGSLLQYGSYKAFIDYIASVYSTASYCFCTEAQWQTAVTNYGSCDKYVYNSTNNTVRLPKRTSEHGALIKSYSGTLDWYRIYQDGWCEQGGHSQGGSSSSLAEVILRKSYVNTNYTVLANNIYSGSAATNSTSAWIKLSNKTTTSFKNVTGYTSASSSAYASYEFDWYACGYTDISDYQYNPIYEYVVIATGTKTEIEVDIDEIATDLNGKADVDLSNCTKPYVVEMYSNGGTQYKLWSNNFYELSGIAVTTATNTLNLQVEFIFPNGFTSFTDTNYKLLTTYNVNSAYSSSTTNINWNQAILWSSATNRKTTTGFYLNRIVSSDGTNVSWYVCGYIS